MSNQADDEITAATTQRQPQTSQTSAQSMQTEFNMCVIDGVSLLTNCRRSLADKINQFETTHKAENYWNANLSNNAQGHWVSSLANTLNQDDQDERWMYDTLNRSQQHYANGIRSKCECDQHG